MLSSQLDLPCKSDPDLWFSTLKSNIVKAKRQCYGCPMKAACLAQVDELETQLGQTIHGVHAGLTPAERRKRRALATA